MAETDYERRKAPNSHTTELLLPYKKSYSVGDVITVMAVSKIAPLKESQSGLGWFNSYTYSKTEIEILSPSGNYIATTIPGESVELILDRSGTYGIRYYGKTGNSVSGGGGSQEEFEFTFFISVIENHYPLKKWTITEVINRLLDVAEPIRKGEKPRFRLDGMDAEGNIVGGQAALFDKIQAPQFSFTKQTLRECLKEVGKVVHGEPRLSVFEENGKYYYKVNYDMYGGMEQSRLFGKKYLKSTLGTAVDNYATHLDSYAENLVNTLAGASPLIEPAPDGSKTLRTEQNYIRITEENMMISTLYPIYSVEKLELVLPERTVDITPYVFEKSVYTTRLSSYSGSYPYARSHALMYTQGEKNITGLNFKSEAQNLIFPAYANYAIVNIVRHATDGEVDLDGYNSNQYVTLPFRITYTPIYNARIEQTKPYYKDYPRAAAQIYNQSANIIEGRYYGENLKGTIARMGNIELTRTFRLAKLSDLPKVGQLYGKEYYIASSTVEFLPNSIMCTVGLSKDFNRISQYIGIPSERRFSEVSETQALERNVLLREYLVIGDKEEEDEDTFMGQPLVDMICEKFIQGHSDDAIHFTGVVAWGESYLGNPSPPAALPVVASAFGNSVSFTWKYKDNYSAGELSNYGEYSNDVSGYFQDDYCYTDYYGRLYYYHFCIRRIENAAEMPKGEIPETDVGFFSTIGKEALILRKDNREALQINAQIDFVTNRKGIIIGSGLAEFCISRETIHAKLYVLDEVINKFSDEIDVASLKDGVTLMSDGKGGLTAGFPKDGKAWVIATEQTADTETVENDRGETVQQIKRVGGRILIAENASVLRGQALALKFTRKRDLYDASVWKKHL